MGSQLKTISSGPILVQGVWKPIYIICSKCRLLALCIRPFVMIKLWEEFPPKLYIITFFLFFMYWSHYRNIVEKFILLCNVIQSNSWEDNIALFSSHQKVTSALLFCLTKLGSYTMGDLFLCVACPLPRLGLMSIQKAPSLSRNSFLLPLFRPAVMPQENRLR